MWPTALHIYASSPQTENARTCRHARSQGPAHSGAEPRPARPVRMRASGCYQIIDGGIVPDPDGIITAGHHNKTARTVAIRQGEAINAPALSAMFKHIIANNRAGGWRKLKHEC